MKTSYELSNLLDSIHRKSYPAYKSLKGEYSFDKYILRIDHVQGDPFASPSKVRIIISKNRGEFPEMLYDKSHKRIALEDHLLRIFHGKTASLSFKTSGSGKSGLIRVSRCGQEILERSACHIDKESMEIRFEVGFPANGRTIDSASLKKILFDYLPDAVASSFFYRNLNQEKVKQCIQLAEDQHYIRSELRARNLTAFAANGSVLPRESGVSSKPLRNAVRFESPKSLEVTMELPNYGTLKGMGVKKGITLIVGGGYHGKSTLLKALEAGVYNHIRGDGREFVITDPTAVKLRAEDGRCITNVDISPFINHLPNGKETHCFRTEDASGSTSQAANVMEAIESGTGLFLIDEDTSATNFMVRDALMQKVIAREKEPITPFIEVVRPIFQEYGISTILVAGSSGSYFYVADTILQMDSYITKDITLEVKQLLVQDGINSIEEFQGGNRLPVTFTRTIHRERTSGRDERTKIKAFGMDEVLLNKETIEVRYLEQLVDEEQVMALGYILNYILRKVADGMKTMQEVVSQLEELLEKKSFMALAEGDYLPSNLARPRTQEIYACLNRYRKLSILNKAE